MLFTAVDYISRYISLVRGLGHENSHFCYITRTVRQRKSISYEEILSVCWLLTWCHCSYVVTSETADGNGQDTVSSRCDRKNNLNLLIWRLQYDTLRTQKPLTFPPLTSQTRQISDENMQTWQLPLQKQNNLAQSNWKLAQHKPACPSLTLRSP